VHANSFTRELVFYGVSRSQSTEPDFENLAYRFQFVAVAIEEPNGSFGQEVYPLLSGPGLGHVSFPPVFLSAQYILYRLISCKTTESNIKHQGFIEECIGLIYSRKAQKDRL
jgi:hypothetical protein